MTPLGSIKALRGKKNYTFVLNLSNSFETWTQ